MTTNRVRNNLGKGKGGALSLQKYFSVLLAVFVFVLGMLADGTADAATATETLSRTVTVQFQVTNQKKTAPIQMTVKLDNMDLTAYAKYTAEIQKNDKYKHIVFAKAAPGSKVTITADPAPIPGMLAKPTKGMNCTESTKFKNHKKIGTLKELTSLGSDKEYSYGKNYTIPNDVEQVTAVVDLTYHVGGMEVGNEMKTSVGTYHQEPRLYRHYYIFTSDAACKKAFELMTASSVTGAISNVFGLLCWAPSATARTGCLAKAEAAKGTAPVIIITLLPLRSQCNGPVRQCLIRMDSNRCNDPVRQCLIRMVRSQCNDPVHRCLIRMDSSQCNDLVRRCLIHMVRSKRNGLAQP